MDDIEIKDELHIDEPESSIEAQNDFTTSSIHNNSRSFAFRIPKHEFLALLQFKTYKAKRQKDQPHSFRRYTVLKPGIWQHLFNEKIWEETKIPCGFHFKNHKVSRRGERGVANGYCKCGAKIKCHIDNTRPPEVGTMILCTYREGNGGQCSKRYLRRPIREAIAEILKSTSANELRQELMGAKNTTTESPLLFSASVLRSAKSKVIEEERGNNENGVEELVDASLFVDDVEKRETEMPSLDCEDLFPNPPRQIDDSSQDIIPDSITAQEIIDDINNASSHQSLPCNEDSSQDNRLSVVKNEDGISNFNLPDVSQDKSQDTNESQSVEDSVERKTATNSAHQSPEGGKTPNQFPLLVVSPALSASSYYSSTESVSSAASTGVKKKKKKKRRHCTTCDIQFPHKRDLLEHLKMHVDQPSVQLESLSEDNQHVQEYRNRQKQLTTSETEEEPETQQPQTAPEVRPPSNESGGLKLKLKMSGSQNFQVVPLNQLTEKSVPIKQSKSPTATVTNNTSAASQPTVDPMKLQPATADENSFENKFFECPTMDGLDQFAEEINHEAAEDLLKKLLECGSQQDIVADHDWASNTNEFMPLDRLAYMCTVCNANYPDAMRLEDHKRLTGHNFQHPMRPPPPPGAMPPHHMDMGNNYRVRSPFQQHMQNLHQMGGPMQQQHGPPMNMRPNYQGFPHPQHQQQQQHQPRFPPAHGFSQAQQQGARRPPPLYRVPNSANPINMAPFAEMNPEMYIPSSNGNMMINGQFQPNQPHMERPPVFLKARLQRPVQRPRTPGMHERSPNATPSPPVGFPQQQTGPRSRLMGPMPVAPPQGPPLKKIKQEPGTDDDCQIISAQPRPDGLPVIQSVQGGASMLPTPKDPIHLNDQITLSIKNKDPNKNPKEVANILATRGIIVTHKPKSSGSGDDTSPKSLTKEAVQKIQLNNSVSIISKKRPQESTAEDTMETRNFSQESSFFTCHMADCNETFLTKEGLLRHTARGHKMNNNTPSSVKAFKCRLCPAIFSTQEGLLDHHRKTHRVMKTSADELGIPIIDLRNEDTKRKLAQLGIVNYIPLNPKANNGCFGFPIVSVQGAANPNICNMLGMGVTSLLSLGPIKQIPSRKME